jgi:hypothetical protein
MKQVILTFIIMCTGHFSFGQLIINTNTTWSTNQVLTQPVIVNQGATLTINPGVVVSVLFIDNNNDLIGDVKIDVKGCLIVNGNGCNKVQFKPYTTTTNKQYWTGINIDTLSSNSQIKSTIITNAKIGVTVENTSFTANGIDIQNCKTNGLFCFGSQSSINITNASFSNCDGEGLKLINTFNSQLNYVKIKNNGSTGLFASSSNITLNNSLFYNNSKSGAYLISSTIVINNSVSRKNLKMGILINNSSFNGDHLDIDSNSIDGIFIGGNSTFNLQNSSLVKNTGFGIETSEYIVNSDFGDIANTGQSPLITINNCNFIQNRSSNVVLTTNEIPGMNSSPYGIGYESSTSGTFCQSLANMCNSNWTESCSNSNLNPSPLNAWCNYQTFHVPFGRFENFVGTVSCNPNGGINPTIFKCAYGISTSYDIQNPYWQWQPNPTSTYNPFANCTSLGGGGLTNSDKITFVSKYAGTNNPVTWSSIANSQPWSKFYIDYFSFRFGGLEYRSLINNSSITDNLTNNFWDTIVPTGVINSVGATLNINGFQIFEISASHSNLSNSYIYGNNNYFELIQNNNSFCTGTTNYLIAPTGNYSYSWFNGTSPIVNNNDSLLIQSNGIYSASISGTCNAISFPVSVSFSNGIPISINTSGATTFCSGGNVTLTSPSSTGNMWSNGATTQSITVSNSGNYSVTVSSSQGCPSVSPAVNVNIISLPQAPVITSSGNTTFCANNSVILTSNISGNLTWSNSMNSQSIIVTSSGSYNVQQTANGCTSLPSNSIQVTVNPTPISTISASGSTNICQGNVVTLNAVISSGNQYQWFNNNVPINGAVNSSLAVVNSGSYTVTVTNGSCSATTVNPTVVTVYSVPIAPIISANGNVVLCQGNNVTLNANNPNVLWSNGSTTQSVSISQSGIYTAQTTLNGCSSVNSNPISITVNSLPSIPVITPNGPTTFCTGASVTLISSYSSGNLWSNNSSTQNVIINNSGTFTVSHTNSYGCISTSLPITVTVNTIPNSPIITANGPTTFCDGSNVTLTSNIISGNQWNSNDQSQSILITNSGTYFTNITENGCTSLPSNSIVVTVNSIPVQPTINPSGPTTFCSGNSLTLTSTSQNGNLWSNGQTSQSITVNNSGQYSVQVIENGCSSTSNQISITVNPTPQSPTIIASGPTTFCQGSNVTLTTNANNGVTWTASNGNQYPVATLIVQSSQSNLFATVTLNGCTSLPSQSINTTVLPILTPNFTQVPSICAGNLLNNLPLTSNNGINGIWSPNINNQVTTNYVFTPASGQCANNANMTITVLAIPNVSISSFSDICDTINSINLTGGAPTGGVYSGVNVNNNEFFTNNSIGSYWVSYTYTNSNGCSNIDSSLINIIECSDSGFDEINETSNILIYPSPTNDIVFIKGLSDEIIGEEINIIDQAGRILYCGIIEEIESTVSIGKYNDGIYLIHLTRHNSIYRVIKI